MLVHIIKSFKTQWKNDFYPLRRIINCALKRIPDLSYLSTGTILSMVWVDVRILFVCRFFFFLFSVKLYRVNMLRKTHFFSCLLFTFWFNFIKSTNFDFLVILKATKLKKFIQNLWIFAQNNCKWCVIFHVFFHNEICLFDVF